MTPPPSKKLTSGDKDEQDPLADCSDDGKSNSSPETVIHTPTQGVAQKRSARPRAESIVTVICRNDDSPPASLMGAAPSIPRPRSSPQIIVVAPLLSQAHVGTPRPATQGPRRELPLAERRRPVPSAAMLRVPKPAHLRSQRQNPVGLPPRGSWIDRLGPVRGAGNQAASRGLSVQVPPPSPAPATPRAVSTPAAPRTPSFFQSLKAKAVVLVGGNRKASTTVSKPPSPTKPSGRRGSSGSDSTVKQNAPWNPTPSQPIDIKNPRTLADRRAQDPYWQVDHNYVPSHRFPPPPSPPALYHPSAGSHRVFSPPRPVSMGRAFRRPISPHTKEMHVRAARAHAAMARRQPPRDVSFAKKSVGPLKNPNPMFYDGMPEGLNPTDYAYWVWLNENFWLIDDGEVMTPAARHQYLLKLQAEEEEASAGDDHEVEHDRGNPYSDDEDDGTDPYAADPSLGFDGANDEDLESPDSDSTIKPDRKKRSSSLGDLVSESHPESSNSRARSRAASLLDPRPFAAHANEHLTDLSDPGTSSTSAPQPSPSSVVDEGLVVIVQAGKNDRNPIPKPLPPSYERPWGTIPDPAAEQAAEQALANWEAEQRSPPVTPTLILTNADRPTEPLEQPKTESKWSLSLFRSRKNSRSSVSSFPTPASILIASQPIVLTPRNKIPVYSRAGTVEHCRMQAKFPYLAFSRSGYLVRSALTIKLIQLYRDARHTPSWAQTIPDYYAVRVAEKADVGIDGWVLYWETLVVKSDIRRGAKLAREAARMLLDEKEAAVEAARILWEEKQSARFA